MSRFSDVGRRILHETCVCDSIHCRPLLWLTAFIICRAAGVAGTTVTGEEDASAASIQVDAGVHTVWTARLSRQINLPRRAVRRLRLMCVHEHRGQEEILGGLVRRLHSLLSESLGSDMTRSQAGLRNVHATYGNVTWLQDERAFSPNKAAAAEISLSSPAGNGTSLPDRAAAAIVGISNNVQKEAPGGLQRQVTRQHETDLHAHVSVVDEGGPDIIHFDGATKMLRNALRRPSSFDPDLDDELPRRYTLQLDEAALLRFAGPGRRLVVSWTTGGPKRYSIAQNLALSIRRNCGLALERIFVFVALDEDAYRRAQADGFQAVLNEGSTDLKDDIWKMRWLIMTTCLSLGLEVLVVDSDIVFFRDPFEHFFFDADQEVMTDHFFPEKHLWATWLRPAEHINTGFIFARPSVELVAFLVEFLDRHYHEKLDTHSERDGMDQRVYNRFVIEKFQTQPPGVFSVFENITFDHVDWQTEPSRTFRFLPHSNWRGRGNGWQPQSNARRIKIRILNPKEIAHGMNFFWRQAHRLRPGGPDGLGGLHRPPAVAHVNGVDPKQYFLRDRNVWYVEEWEERFGDRPSFMIYHHPRGLSLKEDFEHLMAAIEVAAYLRRRVVLPDTMNCANSPAFEVWRMNESLPDTQGCTYDYFAHANGLYEVYSRVKPFCVEAGLKRTHSFRALLARSRLDLPGLQELQRSGQLRDEILAIQERPSNVAAFDEARVLQIPADIDVRKLRDGLRRGDFGLRMNAERIFSCAYQQTLTSAMACLDEPYIEEFGPSALTKCEAVPTGCGPVGVCCCWPFWGYGEKLQYFTGVSWNLPCNCGLDLCEEYARPLDFADATNRTQADLCCRHFGNPSLNPFVEPGVFSCKEHGQWNGLTAAEDAHTYSTTSLSEFLRGKRTADQVFRTCYLDRRMRRGEAFREVALRWCNLQMSAFLLREGALDRAVEWWTWVLQERRGLGNASLLVAALDGNGTETDNTQLELRKLRHDFEQLSHLARAGSNSEQLLDSLNGVGVKKPSAEATNASSSSSQLPASWRKQLKRQFVADELLPKYEALLVALDAFMGPGGGSREIVLTAFESVRQFYNRALYVPNVRLPQGVMAINGHGRRQDFIEAEQALRRDGIAVIDDFLAPEALTLSRELLVDSTVWFASKSGGALLKAQLKDGLHAELGLQIAVELRNKWAPSVFGQQQLLDIVAYKMDPAVGSPGLAPHCQDGVVALNIWVIDDDSADFQPNGNGLRIYNVSVPAEFSRHEAYSVEAGQTAIPQLLRQQKDANVRTVPYKTNRAVLWRSKLACETEWNPTTWSREYVSRRVDWIFTFGRSQIRGEERSKGRVSAGKASGYVPSFEGRADTRDGDHYYANDHDHR
eukprot:TRINITY_DN22823_c0_g1_i1.p1 TRINITY_DN22823_c0_g1~~TRINITY_DN22823_c0_g1_i1.p1  ORF type:complete len:1364 (+),score=168.75 TRINITY_DN22823_c0_g1_i1:220-4311(+)